jgi:hypothetical protein
MKQVQDGAGEGIWGQHLVTVFNYQQFSMERKGSLASTGGENSMCCGR